MINMNIGGQLVSNQGGVKGMQLNFKLNQPGAAGMQDPQSPLQMRAAQAAARTSLDAEFELIHEENAMSNANLLSKLSYTVETGSESQDFANYIRAFSLDGEGFRSLNDYDVEGIVNTVAARYTALSEQISSGKFSDETKAKMQEELDRQLEAGLKDLGADFGTAAQGLFESLGMSNGGKDAGNALVEFVKQKKDEFLNFLSTSEGKEYLKQAQAESPDVKLNSDDNALAKVLLRHEAQVRLDKKKTEEENALAAAKEAEKTGKLPEKKDIEEADKKGSTTFSMADLKSLGKLQSALSSFVNDDTSITEEQLGYQMGLTYVKAQEVLKNNGASSYMTELFDKNFENFVDSKVKSFNEVLKAKQEEAEELSGTSAEAYKEFSTKNVMDAFNATRGVYNATGNASDAVVNGFEIVKESFLANQASNANTIRYKNDSFFSSFYNGDKDNQAYDMGLSTFRRYHNNINRV